MQCYHHRQMCRLETKSNFSYEPIALTLTVILVVALGSEKFNLKTQVVTLRVYQISASNSAEYLKFSSVCHSDGIRMTGWCKCRGLTLDPKTESKIFVQLSDGRILAWQLEARVGKCRLQFYDCLLYTSPSPRDGLLSRMPSSA